MYHIHICPHRGHGFESRLERFSYGKASACAPKQCLPGSPGIETKLVGPRTAVDGNVTSQGSLRSWAGGMMEGLPWLGNRLTSFPGSSVFTSSLFVIRPRVYICVLHIKPYFPSVDLQHTQCVLTLRPREIQGLWSQNTD